MSLVDTDCDVTHLMAYTTSSIVSPGRVGRGGGTALPD